MNHQPRHFRREAVPRAMRLARVAPRRTGDVAQGLSIWTIRLFLVGALLREVLGQSEVLQLGAFNLHTVDPAIVVGLVACAGHLLRSRLEWRAFTVPIMLMVALIGINFVRGLAIDPFPAMLWARANGSIAVMLLLAVCVRPTAQLHQATRSALLLVAACLALLVALRLAFGANLLMISGVGEFEANDGGRALTSGGAFVLALASGLLTSELLQRARIAIDGKLALAIAIAATALLTRQATAILAGFALLATLFAFQRGGLRPGRVVLSLVVIVAASIVLIMVYPVIAESDDVLRRAGTLDARREIWRALNAMWPSQPWGTQLFGYPAGQFPALEVYMSGGYRAWSVSIHSMYYGALPIMGYAGALSYVVLLAIVAGQALLANMRQAPPFPAFALAFCLATAVLSYSYEVRADSLIGLFLAIVWLRASDPVRRPPPPGHSDGSSGRL